MICIMIWYLLKCHGSQENLLPSVLETSTFWTWGPLRWLSTQRQTWLFVRYKNSQKFWEQEKSNKKMHPQPGKRQKYIIYNSWILLKDSLVKVVNLFSRWFSSEYGMTSWESSKIQSFESPRLRLCQLPVFRTAWHKLVVFWLSILRWPMVQEGDLKTLKSGTGPKMSKGMGDLEHENLVKSSIIWQHTIILENVLASDLKQKGQPSCLYRHSRPPMSRCDLEIWMNLVHQSHHSWRFLPGK